MTTTFPHIFKLKFHSLDSSILSHLQGTVITVGSRAIPIALDGFGVKGHNNSKVFCYPV